MTKTALVLGASGQIGEAVIPALLRDGWHVRAGSRTDHAWPDSVEGTLVDRENDESFDAALGRGVDLLVDCVAYTDAHARQIVGATDRIGSAVVISSISVYADGKGRTLDEATGADDFPHLPLPVHETQATVAPGPATYSTRKAAMEKVLLDASTSLPVTVLRAGAIYGPGSIHPRELWFIKRALDRRPVQILNWGGLSRFHLSGTRNIAELVRLAAGNPDSRVLNAVDEKALTTGEIGEITNALLGHHPDEFLIEGASNLGDTPWSVPKPIVADMAEAEVQLGYRAVAAFEDSLPSIVERIVGTIGDGDWASAYPTFLRANGEGAFDYAAEDAWVREIRRGPASADTD